MPILNGKPKGHTDRARELANYLEDVDWDEPTQPNITIHNHVDVADTGKFQAMEAPTKPDQEKPTLPSPPDSKANVVVRGITTILGSVKTWPQVVALAILVGALVYAGKAAGWW